MRKKTTDPQGFEYENDLLAEALMVTALMSEQIESRLERIEAATSALLLHERCSACDALVESWEGLHA